MQRRYALAAVAFVALSLIHAPRAHAIGMLVPTAPELEPLAIRYHRVNVQVRERVAVTRVEQTFRNQTGRVLEATYLFPIPEGATVSGFSMWVDGRRQNGELLESGPAREIYESIVARMRDPGLVEQIGGRLFRARVFPIAANSEQRIEIEFTQTLDYHDSVVHFRYPLHTDGRAAQTLEDFTMTVDIASRTPIRAVYSPTHPIAVARPTEHRATVGFERNDALLEDDFDLYYSVQDRDVGLSLLTHRVPGEDGYFLALIAPRAEITEREIAAKEVLFVVDTSGSMEGDKIRRAQAALDAMLSRLNPQDRFQVIRFSTDVQPMFVGGASVPATPDNVARARYYGERFVAAGGTAIHGALREAMFTRGAAGLPRTVVLLTDGMPTVGEIDLDRITEDVSGWARQANGQSRVYVFGVGDDVNTTFLDRVAQRTGGVGDYFRDGAEMENRMRAFYDRIAYPVLTDLRLSLGDLSVLDVYPQDLGNLYRGGQLMVVGRYRGDGPVELALDGRLAHEDRAQRFAYPVEFPTRELRNDFLPRVWATRKIGFLLDQIRLNGERPELRREVVALAERFGIVTPYTSYLVVEEDAIPPELSARVHRSMPAQAGTRFDFEDERIDGEMVRPDTVMSAPEPAPAHRGGRGGGGGGSRHAEAASDFGGWDGAVYGGGGSGGGGESSGRTASAPHAASGESGRRIARAVRGMREAERAQEASRTRFVAGHTFRLIQDMWVDRAYRRTLRTLHVRAGSAGWIALSRDRPDLRPLLALGERVAIAIDEHRAVIVEPEAPADVSEAQVGSFLAD
ncbi:MAG: VIT domain-containing protein [Sandaracinaceae bacterium]